MDLQICSLNVRGIRERQKKELRTVHLEKCKSCFIDILQEVNGSEDTTTFWSAEWVYNTSV